MSILFRKDTLSCVLAVTLVFSGTVLAQPKPNDVEYNDSRGEIVITGSGFGNGPNVMLFDNFEHGSKFSDLLSSKSNSWIGDVLIQSEASGNKAKKARDPSKTQGNMMSQMTINFGGNYTEAFMSFSVKTPAGTTFPAASTTKTFPKDSSWKFVWLMSGTRGFDAGGGFDVCLPSHVGSGNFLLGGNDGNLTWLEKGSNWWEWDNYNHMSSYVKFSSSQPSTGPVEYFWSVTNNLKTLRSSGETAASQFRSSDFGFDRINIPGWWGNGDNTKFNGLYDNLYVAVGANARARAVLTDSESYSSRKFEMTVLPKSWSDGRIVLDEDVLPDEKQYYLHVFDSSDRRAAKSVKICPKCPKMPST